MLGSGGLIKVGITVYVTSYLRKSNDFCGSLSRISVKVCVEICLWRAHRIIFWESAELSFRCPWIRLMGVLQMVYGRPQVIESTKSSSRSLISFVTHAINKHYGDCNYSDAYSYLR